MSNQRKNIGAFGFAIAAVACTLALPMASASAQNFFEMLFGGVRRSAPPPPPAPLPAVRPSADPSRMIDGYRSESGPSTAYCVRLCDGHPFPVQSAAGSAAQACAAMCPAAQTKLFNGGSIDHAVSSDGKRYAALPAAFVYRKQVIAGCTCNGKTAGGLAQIDVKSDPTLRPGDIVVTDKGLMSYRGGSGRSADFTPLQDRKLANIPIRSAPVSASALAANAQAEEPPPRNVEQPASSEGRRRAQPR
ncbi:MAG TPA: DUF2865 domain-containing protein [Xanthobacteraceae bacterium]|nr:DUF2865 domain-containing protein [Xanthobacteraceae bacterium]